MNLRWKIITNILIIIKNLFSTEKFCCYFFLSKEFCFRLKIFNIDHYIWMYTILSNYMDCIQFTSIQQNSLSFLMLNDNQLFIMGQDISTPTLFHMYKITYSTWVYNWASKISSSYGCSTTFSESIQNSDSSKIYSLFLLESNSYAYFITLNATDGSAVDSRYKSSISWSYVLGSISNGDNVIFSANCASTYYLFVYDISSLKLSVNKWTNILYGIAIEPSTNR